MAVRLSDWGGTMQHYGSKPLRPCFSLAQPDAGEVVLLARAGRVLSIQGGYMPSPPAIEGSRASGAKRR
jgi:hypothetical protein